jgi:hypothetical protein
MKFGDLPSFVRLGAKVASYYHKRLDEPLMRAAFYHRCLMMTIWAWPFQAGVAAFPRQFVTRFRVAGLACSMNLLLASCSHCVDKHSTGAVMRAVDKSIKAFQYVHAERPFD